MHSSFCEVRITKIDPVVTRARHTRHAKYEQIYGQNEHLARANKASDGPNRSPAWSRGLPRHFDFPAGRVGVGGFGAHGCTGGATGAGLFGLLDNPANRGGHTCTELGNGGAVGRFMCYLDHLQATGPTDHLPTYKRQPY
jgi:hypothetical protein